MSGIPKFIVPPYDENEEAVADMLDRVDESFDRGDFETAQNAQDLVDALKQPDSDVVAPQVGEDVVAVINMLVAQNADSIAKIATLTQMVTELNQTIQFVLRQVDANHKSIHRLDNKSDPNQVYGPPPKSNPAFDEAKMQGVIDNLVAKGILNPERDRKELNEAIQEYKAAEAKEQQTEPEKTPDPIGQVWEQADKQEG